MIALVASLWWSSRIPSAFGVTVLGSSDWGGGPVVGHDHGTERSITSLVGDPTRRPDVRVDLVARKGVVRLADGRSVDGYSLNGRTPGPTITATQGQLVEVHLRNEDIPDGITLHWHGVEVPNAMDGVAGVTQDAVAPGTSFTYRFAATRAGTYWYHSHQMSHPQTSGGILGTIVVLPRSGLGDVDDVPALVHAFGGLRTVNGRAGETRVDARPGALVRLRLVNSDPGPMPVWVNGAAYRVVAVDGRELTGAGTVEGKSVVVTAGARADLEIRVPARGGARVQMAGASIVLGPGPAPTSGSPAARLDLLTYGTPTPLDFDPRRPDRTFRYDIGARIGLLDGRPGRWWTVNGHLYPDVPMFMVREGDLVRFRISNHSGEVHPMHLHGHHVLVLSRNGIPATGARWWVDSLDVGDGETYEVTFVADNPGVWMDHCHNLPHAAQGLTAHLMYAGWTTPYVLGGDHANVPE